LRSQTYQPELAQTVQWWTKAQTATADELTNMCGSLPSGKRKRRKRKKKNPNEA